MTKSRDALTPFLALTRSAGVLTWEKIAELTGRAVRTVQNWSDPDTTSQVSLQHALKIDVAAMAAGDPPHIYRWYTQELQLAESEQRRDQAAIATSAAKAFKEVGDMTAATIAAIAPGAGRTELLIAEREATEAYEAIGHTLHDIRAAAHPGEASN